jgi:hypothetical protein
VLFVLPRLFIKTLGGRLKNAVHNLKQLPTDPAVAWRELIIVLNCQAIADGLCGGLILVLCLALDISVQLNGITRVYSSVQCGRGECWQAQGGRDAGTVRRWAALGVASLLVYESVLVRHQKLRWKLMHTLAGEAPVQFPEIIHQLIETRSAASIDQTQISLETRDVSIL